MKPTREYTGGLLGGTGLGLLVAGWILKSGHTDLPWSGFLAFGFGFIAVGSALARAGQRAVEKRD